MSLNQWDRDIGHHLKMIRTSSQEIVIHVHALMGRPIFETQADDELEKCLEALTGALSRVLRARDEIRRKSYAR